MQKKTLGDNITLHQGNTNLLLPELLASGARFDALITDPPYSSGGAGNAVRASTKVKYAVNNTKRTYPEFIGDTRDQFSLALWLGHSLTYCYDMLTEGAPIMLFSDWRQLSVMHQSLQYAGFTLRGVLAWDKTRGVRPNMVFFNQQAEFILVGCKGHKPRKWGHGASHDGVYTCSPLKGGKHHQTGKPVDVMKWLVSATAKDAHVFDPFMGSGSTGVACKTLGRNFTGIEYVPAYYEIAIDRISNS